MKHRALSMLFAVAGVMILIFAPTAFAQDAASGERDPHERQPLRSYSVRVSGERKSHSITLGVEDPESVPCPYCGAQTTDITRVYTLPDGAEEVTCDTHQYGTDILCHYLDCYQAVCHNCPSVGTLDGSTLEDQAFAIEQERTLIFCEGRRHI